MANDRSSLITLLAFSISFGTLLASSSRAEVANFIARTVSVTGKVLVRVEGSGNVQMNFLKAGDKLYKGAIVNTGSNGAVKLLMTDRTILDLGPSTLFKMNDYQLGQNVGDRTVDMSLDYGQVRASVNEKITSNKGKFTIRTKAATMGVRGTEFVVNSTVPASGITANAQNSQTSVTVMHGKVEVADAAKPAAPPVAVTPGLQFAKSSSGVSTVSQLNPEQIAEVKAGAFQKDMTFLQAVSMDADSGKGNKENKQEGKSDTKSADARGGGEAAPPQGGGKQTLENIGMTIESQSKTGDQPKISDLNLPGVFTPGVPQTRPIDQLNGRLVNLKIIINNP